MEATGSWAVVLYVVAAMDLTAAFAALFVLRPMLARHHPSEAEAANALAGSRGRCARLMKGPSAAL